MDTQSVEFRSKPPCHREDAAIVVQRLRDNGHVAYFAGGCVRDLVLGLEPKDYDVATDAPPDRVQTLFKRTQAVGAAFGVILVREGRSVIEVATFRSEGPYLDGRRPSKVHFTTAEEDAKRRDFTINGLFFDPVTSQVIDYVGGQEDLRAKRLRAIGDPRARFREDHLRLLRAIRFAARFGLEIESATAEAIRADAHLLKAISPERIAEELRLMLTPFTRTAAWGMLWDFRLIDEVFRFLPEQSDARLDASRSIFLATDPSKSISFGLALASATICYRRQKEDRKSDLRTLLTRSEVRKSVQAMRQGLRFSNEESDEMEGALEGLGPLLADTPPTVAMKKRFLARATSRASRQLMDAMGAVGCFSDPIQSLRADLSELEQSDYAPPPLITGDDLTAAGLSPGRAFKKILDDVYDAQLEGRVTTRDEAMRMALHS